MSARLHTSRISPSNELAQQTYVPFDSPNAGRFHIGLAMMSMVEVTTDEEHKNLKGPATVCLVLYVIKVFSHSLVVFFRWRDNGKYDSDAGKVGNSTHRWCVAHSTSTPTYS